MKTNSIENGELIQTDWFEVPGGKIYRTFYQNEQGPVSVAMVFVPHPLENEPHKFAT
jgi:hypothetical protein